MNLSSSMVCFSVHNGQYSQSSDNLFFNVSVNVERKEQPDVAAGSWQGWQSWRCHQQLVG